MFPYLRKNSDYLDDCSDPEKVSEELRNRVNASYWRGRGVNGAEVTSWEESTFGYMADVLRDCDPNHCIGVEYFSERDGAGRVDMMAGGYDSDGRMKILIIELKRWSGVKSVPGDTDHCIPCSIENGELKDSFDRTDLCVPALSLQNYICSITMHNDADIDLIPVICAHNMSPEHDLIGMSRNGYAHVFYEGMRDDLVRFINDTLVSGKTFEENRAVFSALRNGYESIPVNLLAELFTEEPVVDGSTGTYDRIVSYLRPDQRYVLDEIISHMQSGERHVDVIKGGPGSGKTLIALLARRKLRIDNRDRNVPDRCIMAYEGTAPVNRLDSEILKAGARKILCVYAGKLGERYDGVRHMIFDEFHRLKDANAGAFSEAFGRMTGTTVLLIDERQKCTSTDVGADLLNIILDGTENISCYTLRSQFRCNQDDGYLSWLDRKFYMGDAPGIKLSELDFRPEIIDDINIFEEDLLHPERRLLLINGNEDLNAINSYGFNETVRAYNRKHGLIEEDEGLAGEWFDVHGIEFSDVLVYIGPDLTLDDLNDPSKEITKNRYRMLLTRGMKSNRIFCYDPRLAEYLRDDERP